MYLQKYSRGGTEDRMDSFLAGLVGGCYIFGNDSAVVQQVPSQIPRHQPLHLPGQLLINR